MPDRNKNIDDRTSVPHWADRRTINFVVLAALTVIAIYLSYLLVQPFMPALVWSITLAVVTHRFWRWLTRNVPRPNLRAGIAVATVAVGLLAPIVFLVYFSATEISNTVEQWQSEEHSSFWQDQLEQNPRIAEAWNWISQNFDIQGMVRQLAQYIQDGATAILSGLAYTAAQAFLTLFILFFLYRDERSVLRTVRRVSPMSDSETDQVLERLRDTTLATIYGSVVTAMIQGALGGLMFWFLGVPGAVLWGAVMGLMALVPYLGTFVVWAPVAILLALSGEWGKAAILVAYGVCVIGTIDNLLYPALVGNRLKQHQVITFIAIIGGISVFGAAGIVLGPVVVTLAFTLLEIWRQRTDDSATVHASAK